MSKQKYFLHAVSFFLATLLLASCAWAQPQGDPAPNMLKNGGFEAPYKAVTRTGSNGAEISGSVADGWQDNSSGFTVATIHYSEEKDQPHSGQSCQKVKVKKAQSGTSQLVQFGLSLQKGHVYKASVWLRSSDATALHFALQHGEAPNKMYAEKTIALSSKWQRAEFIVVAPETAQDMLMILADAPATYYVDDASLEDITDIVNNQPKRTGNLLPDGSFETGMGSGWSVGYHLDVYGAEKNVYADPRPRLDTAAYTGKHSLRMDIPAAMSATVSSPPITLNFNKSYVASFWVKASRADNINVALKENVDIAQQRTILTKTFPVTTEWTRVVLESKPDPYVPEAYLTIYSAAVSKPMTLWMDGAMLEERTEPSSAYLPAFPAELSLSTSRPGSIFFDGQSAQIDVSTAWDSASSPSQDAHLALQLEDVDGTITKLPSQKLSVSKVTIPAAANHSRGIWKLRAQVESATGEALSAQTEQVFARLPHPRVLTPAESEDSYFGVHIPLTAQYIQIAQDTGAHWVRLHDYSQVTMWSIVEPRKGQWNWINDGVDAAHRAGLHLLGMISTAPPWATKTPRTDWSLYNLPDADGAIADWQEYARRTSEHFKGSINDWEIWNEPYWKGFFQGTPEQYAELVRTASLAVRAATPDAKIIISGGSLDSNSTRSWSEHVIAAAPSSFYDMASFHSYTFGVFGGPNSMAADYTKFLENTLAQHGGERPLWNTEEGSFGVNSWYNLNNPEMQYQMTWIVRNEVAQLGAGVRKIFYYSVVETSSRTNDIPALEYDRSLKPVMAARAVLAYLVDGAKSTGRTEPQPGIDQYTFQFADGKTVDVLWSFDSKTHQMEVPKGAQALDIMGNKIPSLKAISIGTEPVYVTTDGNRK